MEHSAWIGIEPKPKGNSQNIATNRKTGRMFVVKDKKVRAREIAVTKLLLACPPRRAFTGAVRLDVTCVLPIPKSWPQWKRAAAAAGCVFPYTAKRTRGGGIADRGNLCKLIEDAIESAGWLANDSQICGGDVSKIYGPTPGYQLRMISLDECLTRDDWLARLASEQAAQPPPEG